MTQTALQGKALLVSFELSKQKWWLTLGLDVKARRQVEVEAGDFKRVTRELRHTKRKLGLPEGAGVVSCYEAGRDGFWIHRQLLALGVENLVVDSASIEVSRRQRRAKSDRLDGAALLRLLARYQAGERDVWRVVRVPPAEAEEARREGRELGRLQQERTGHCARLRSLLAQHGLQCGTLHGLRARLSGLREWDGRPLGAHVVGELQRECARLELVEAQIRELEGRRKAEVQAARAAGAQAPQALRKVVVLKQLRGIDASAWTLIQEFFGWREFSNGKEVGGLAGLTGTPYASGASSRDQGISKAGNWRVRAVMVELAWSWLRYQPHSRLSRWFEERYGRGAKRNRRVGIVALARRLLVALWKYVERGELPEGAVLKASA